MLRFNPLRWPLLMPVAGDLVVFLSANAPTNDTGTSGGARSSVGRPLDSQFTADAVGAVLSSAAGDTTQTLTITGRLASGAIDTDILTLNGTTQVVGTDVFDRILSLQLSASTAGTITFRQGAGGTTRHTFAPGQTFAAILFQSAAADPSAQRIRMEKLFWRNGHASEALLSAQLQIATDPNSNYRGAVSGAVDDTESTANRLTAPSGETFVDDGVNQAVPGTNLAATAAIGYWLEQTLAAAEAAAIETVTIQISGSSV